MDSNASLPGEVERNVSRDNDISCCGKLYQRASSFPAVSRTRQSPWMVFRLVEIAQRSWRRLHAPHQLPKVVVDVRFTDGLEAMDNVNCQPKAAA